DKNEDHNWNVVSRGVAESGLERGKYDMMIVIPNDFSQKAISIESDAPEQVVLDYKINASDNDKVQAQAEETASSILNDFNRQIIDVYFASIIGNLQDAQDSVGEIFKKEAEYTYTYNNAIDNPLSNYTDRFEAVKNNTAASKDSFSGLEDVLNRFEDGLANRVDSSEEFLSSIDDVEQQNQAVSKLNMNFMDQLSNYQSNLTDGNLEEKLKNLQEVNAYMNDQFQQNNDNADDHTDEQMKNITSNTKALKARLAIALENIEQAHDDLEENLGENGNLNQKVEERLREIMGGEFNDLFDKPDQNAQQHIKDQIDKLPTPYGEDLSTLGFSDNPEFRNVTNVTEKFNDEFEYEPSYS